MRSNWRQVRDRQSRRAGALTVSITAHSASRGPCLSRTLALCSSHVSALSFKVPPDPWPFILLKLEMEPRASHGQEALYLRDSLALKGLLLSPALPWPA